MANGDGGGEGEGEVMMFSEEEVREMIGLKNDKDCFEVMCGCTSRRYGDAVGRFRVFVNGDLEISCDCTPGCQEGSFSFSLSFYYVCPLKHLPWPLH